MKQLYPHQEEAVSYAKRVGDPAFFMEMRLGKSPTLIHWAAGAGKGACLLVAPVTTLGDFEDELLQAGEPYIPLYLAPRAKREALLCEAMEASHRTWTLCSYGLLHSMPLIADLPWDLAALDESRKIANPTSQITRLCLSRFEQTRSRAILSGLPNPENQLEVFSQFCFLDGSFMGCTNYWDFRATYYEQPKWDRYNWQPKKGMTTCIKEAIHERAFIRNRKQVGMGSEKVYQKRRCEMEPKQRALYKEVLDDFAYVAAGEWQETQWSMTRTLWLQRIAGGFDPSGEHLISNTKFKELLSLLQGELAGEQVVVWFRFTAELEAAAELLAKAKISHVKLNGSVPIPKRRGVLQPWREGRQRILLASQRCAKAGLDCSQASTAIYYSQEWSNDDRKQSEDRIVHPAKKEPLLLIDLCLADTVDEEVSTRIKGKDFDSKVLMRRLAGARK